MRPEEEKMPNTDALHFDSNFLLVPLLRLVALVRPLPPLLHHHLLLVPFFRGVLHEYFMVTCALDGRFQVGTGFSWCFHFSSSFFLLFFFLSLSTAGFNQTSAADAADADAVPTAAAIHLQ